MTRRIPRTAEPIESVAFRRPDRLPLGIETLTVAQLRTRGSAEHFARVQRMEFVTHFLCTGGAGEHLVDFVVHPLRPGTLITVFTGQVHQYRLHPAIAGRLIVLDPTFALPRHLANLPSLGPPGSLHAGLPPAMQLDATLAASFVATADAIEADTRRYRDHPLLDVLLRERFHLLLLELRMGPATTQAGRAPGAAHADALVMAFLKLVESAYGRRWSVAEYARRLGYAERTLRRACLDRLGRSAKTVIDERVVLEARRLLAHGEATVAAIAERLGFDDPANFGRFFRRETGTTPAAFRRAWA